MVLDTRQILERQIDAIYGLRVGPGRFPRVARKDVRAVVSWSREAFILALGKTVAIDESTIEIDEQYRGDSVPLTITALAERFAQEETETRTGPVSFKGGPSFLVPRDLTASPIDYPIVVSDSSGSARARSFERPHNWEPDEWIGLIEGRIGGWAMAVHNEQPVSICHTSAYTDDVAEAGAWTREDFRGQGLAAATVSAWARGEYQTKELVFYSTWHDNAQSQAVARKLALKLLGWKWIIL